MGRSGLLFLSACQTKTEENRVFPLPLKANVSELRFKQSPRGRLYSVGKWARRWERCSVLFRFADLGQPFGGMA